MSKHLIPNEVLAISKPSWCPGHLGMTLQSENSLAAFISVAWHDPFQGVHLKMPN